MRILTLAIALLLLLGARAQADTFDPSGFFYLDGSPKAFAEVQAFNLHQDGGKWVVWVETTKNLRFADANATVQAKKLKFSTKPQNGVYYTFSGTFVKDGQFASAQPTGVVLKGTLTRWSKGKISAQKPINFTYWVGD